MMNFDDMLRRHGMYRERRMVVDLKAGDIVLDDRMFACEIIGVAPTGTGMIDIHYETGGVGIGGRIRTMTLAPGDEIDWIVPIG